MEMDQTYLNNPWFPAALALTTAAMQIMATTCKYMVAQNW